MGWLGKLFDRLCRSLSFDITFVEHPVPVLYCLGAFRTGLLRSDIFSVLLVPLCTPYQLTATPSPLTAWPLLAVAGPEFVLIREPLDLGFPFIPLVVFFLQLSNFCVNPEPSKLALNKCWNISIQLRYPPSWEWDGNWNLGCIALTVSNWTDLLAPSCFAVSKTFFIHALFSSEFSQLPKYDVPDPFTQDPPSSPWSGVGCVRITKRRNLNIK